MALRHERVVIRPQLRFGQEPGIQANAELQADPEALPRVGEVFYVRSVIARIGDGCGIDMLGHVEIVPPPGVTTAISAQHPVRCEWMDITTGALSPAGGCPQEAQEAVYGPGFDQLTPGGSTPTYPWRIAYQQALVIEVPLRSNRGLQGTSPSCSRWRGRPALHDAEPVGRHAPVHDQDARRLVERVAVPVCAAVRRRRRRARAPRAPGAGAPGGGAEPVRPHCSRACPAR